ncbi:MAG: hypothetical protein JWP16_2310, partial [Alphaproteobacteria bacterium]|nr:hypothetical protein [Alphaproteobacteria bacterium]
MMDGHALPHEDIMESLRPILKRDQFERTLTPLRLFCHPFQDLLTCAPRRAKQKGAIARGSLVPVWNWLSHTLIPADTSAYVSDVKTLLLKHQIEEAFARAACYWPLAAAAITAALDGEVSRKLAQKILGDAFAVDDACEMAVLLAAGEDIEKLSALLPRPVASLNESLLWEVRAVYDAVAASHPDAAPYVAVVTMNRLARPWEALRLPMLVTRKIDET